VVEEVEVEEDHLLHQQASLSQLKDNMFCHPKATSN
jgi:hypothetical protein